MTITKTCFLVDDDQDDQEIFLLALENLKTNIDCSIANSAEEAIEKLVTSTQGVPHYIFIDYFMPGMNGKECLAELRKHDHLKGVEVCVYTSAVEMFTHEEISTLDIKAIIPKSPNLELISGNLQKVLFNS